MNRAAMTRRHRTPNQQNENDKKTPFFSKESRAPFFSAGIQAKLSIGQPGNTYEKEADTMADAVVNNPTSRPAIQNKEISGIQRETLATPLEDEKLGTNDPRMRKDKEIQEKREVQRMCPGCEKEKEEMGGALQTKDGGENAASPHLASKIESAAGKGSTLPKNTLSEMNSSFGVDFSNVNVHTGTDAVQMNKELGAQAFTHGSDIYFNNGKYNPESSGGKQLLAHELTHVVQQGSSGYLYNSVQRSCNDGACDSCFGGVRDFWITFYFRRRATRRTMTYLRQQINDAKVVLAKCCLRLKADFNWTLLQGGGNFNFMDANPDGSWHYSNDASTLGTGNTFAGSMGIPVLVVDDVPNSGGGVTVDDQFDTNYHGRTYAVIGVNQTNPNSGCNHLAHELWHVGSGIVGHDVAHGNLAACQGNNVSPEYCIGLRNIVAPVGDFPLSTDNHGTSVA